ncbi:MAG: hypothetical protein M0Z71_12075 [Nitrospiraceae bacterium]|nr:hypothetical protein [Nitrospiraceae bacterium]
MKLSMFLSREAKKALRNFALDYEAGLYARRVKEMRIGRNDLTVKEKSHGRQIESTLFHRKSQGR